MDSQHHPQEPSQDDATQAACNHFNPKLRVGLGYRNNDMGNPPTVAYVVCPACKEGWFFIDGDDLEATLELLTVENMETMRAQAYGDGYEAGYDVGWKAAIDTFSQLVTGFRELVPGGANRAGVEAFNRSRHQPQEVRR